MLQEEWDKVSNMQDLRGLTSVAVDAKWGLPQIMHPFEAQDFRNDFEGLTVGELQSLPSKICILLIILGLRNDIRVLSMGYFGSSLDSKTHCAAVFCVAFFTEVAFLALFCIFILDFVNCTYLCQLNRAVGFLLSFISLSIFTYYTFWVIILPFVDTDHFIHKYFLPQEYAILIPVFAGVAILCFLSIFIGYVMLKSKKKKA
ncbi:Dolichol phosphate-mannose biosynthesis regulatory [Dillenia turbinata]|uniref:Dolichol phosphate-mannose biosynthesis regulatory protein n=1 Tax=Dillenia turbinata TaxID=194707 RepID=A0AAN8ZRU8_9MAGN